MRLEPTPIEGLQILRRTPHADSRGAFEKLFDQEDSPFPAGRSIAQVNYSTTRGLGSVRGMHFQNPPFAETKVVTCLEGEVFDVAVDLRKGSPTFMKWFAVRLRGDSSDSLRIPAGMAHGFQVLSAEARLLYFHDQPYRPAAEGCIHPLDQTVGIDWPEPVRNLSPRDDSAPRLTSEFVGIDVEL